MTTVPTRNGAQSARKALSRNAIENGVVERLSVFINASLREGRMHKKLMLLATTALVMGLPSVAMARYPCAPGFAPYRGVCRLIGVYGYGNPVSGAASGEANGAARGNATAGPVGAIVGGAVGTATGTLRGTFNMLMGR